MYSLTLHTQLFKGYNWMWADVDCTKFDYYFICKIEGERGGVKGESGGGWRGAGRGAGWKVGVVERTGGL